MVEWDRWLFTRQGFRCPLPRWLVQKISGRGGKVAAIAKDSWKKRILGNNSMATRGVSNPRESKMCPEEAAEKEQVQTNLLSRGLGGRWGGWTEEPEGWWDQGRSWDLDLHKGYRSTERRTRKCPGKTRGQWLVALGALHMYRVSGISCLGGQCCWQSRLARERWGAPTVMNEKLMRNLYGVIYKHSELGTLGLKNYTPKYVALHLCWLILCQCDVHLKGGNLPWESASISSGYTQACGAWDLARW